MINISICVDDIPKDKITTGKNGKRYLNLVVDKRKEKDKFDNDHTVYISQSKDERTAKLPKVYVGNGKELVFGGQQAAPQAQSTTYTPPAYDPHSGNDSDLPF